MDILCCFKISPDYDKVVSADWEAGKAPDTGYVPKGFGCYDEAALELSLRLRDEAAAAGDSARITAATVGSEQYERFARALFSVGFDRVVQIKTEAGDFAPETVSAALARTFDDETFDAVLCGVQSTEGCGMTPFRLAKRLGLPCLSHVTDLHVSGRSLRVTRETARGELAATVTAPVVYAVSNSRHPYLRMATVKKRLAVADRRAEPFELSVSKAEPLQATGFHFETGGRHCVFIEGETCAEKAASLLRLCPEVHP